MMVDTLTHRDVNNLTSHRNESFCFKEEKKFIVKMTNKSLWNEEEEEKRWLTGQQLAGGNKFRNVFGKKKLSTETLFFAVLRLLRRFKLVF